jgi:hypothetical protein
MFRKIKIAFALSAVLYLCILNWNCTKIDTTNVGAGLIPAVDNVHTFDTTMEVIAVNYDSTNSPTTSTGFLGCDSLGHHRLHVFGNISAGQDPQFGTTKAAMYFQLLPTRFPYSFAGPTNRFSGDDTIIGYKFDSAVLVLKYHHSWGDSTVPQTMNVYRMNYDTSVFNALTTFTTCGDPTSFIGPLLATKTFIPANINTDSIKDISDSGLLRELRIPMPTSLVQELYAQDSIGMNGGYNNDSAFKTKLLAGLALIPGNSGTCLSYFDLDAADTKLAIYYRYKRTTTSTGVPVIDTPKTVANFKFTSLAGERNSVARDHSGAQILAHLTQPPPASGHDFIYIQTSPGTFAKLTIPKLNGFPNALIHRAELVLDQDVVNPFTDSLYSAPNFMTLETLDDAKGPSGTYRTIPCDFIVSNGFPNFGTFGGFKKTVTDASGTHNEYVFNISRYIQNFITFGKKDIKLRLTAPYHLARNTSFVDECNIDLATFSLQINEAAEGRVRLKGANTATPKLGMHLRIIYSKL